MAVDAPRAPTSRNRGWCHPSALESRAFALLFAGRAVSGLGDRLAPIALAFAVLDLTGPGLGLGVDALTFAISAACMGRMRPCAAAAAERAGAIAELRAGWRAFRARTWLWVTVALFAILVACVFSPMLVLGPQVAQVSLGGSGAWAAISTARGLGAVLGGIIGLRWRPRHPLRSAFVALLVTGPAFLVLLAVPAALEAIVAYAVLSGASATIFMVLWGTALQRDVPASELSRVSSWDYLGSLALQPIGYAASGPIAAAAGVSATLLGAAGLFVLVILIGLAVPAVRDFSGERPARAPELVLQR
jgi:hypothetical protein